jgi:hypothetical protein
MNNEDNKDFMAQVSLKSTFARLDNIAEGVDEERLQTDSNYLLEIITQLGENDENQKKALGVWVAMEKKRLADGFYSDEDEK